MVQNHTAGLEAETKLLDDLLPDEEGFDGMGDAEDAPANLKDGGQASKLQDTMANMSKEDLAKWTGRAQTVARWTAKPLALYRKVSSLVPPTYLLAGLVALFALMVYGHQTDSF